MTTSTEAATAGTALPLRCGVFRLGGTHVAVATDDLREVVPRPRRLAPVPQAVPGLLGAMPLREQVVPVVDLHGVLGGDASDPTEAEQVVVVVAVGGGVLGLVADTVVGVAALAPEQLLEVAVAQPPGAPGQLFSHVFHGADGTVVSLLDVARLVEAGLPVVAAPRRLDDAYRAAGTAPLLLVRCGPVHLGLDISAVSSTLPTLPVRDSPVRAGACRGVVDVDGAPLAVVDTLALLDLGTLDDEGPQSVSLRLPEGSVALLVSEVVDIVAVPRADVLALAPGAVERPDRFVGAAAVPGRGDVLVVDVAALAAEPDLAALARIRAADVAAAAGRGTDGDRSAPPPSGDDTGHRAPLGEQLLALDAGLELVTPVDGVSEVIPLPAAPVLGTAGPAPGSGRLGFVTHRGVVVPLVSLPELLGEDPALPGTACVLVVRTGAGPLGLVARRLLAIERSVWAPAHDGPPTRTGDPVADALADRLLVRTEVVGTGERRTRTRVDLRAVAAAVQEGLTGTAVAALPGVPAPRDGDRAYLPTA